jgi:hypothetical protein
VPDAVQLAFTEGKDRPPDWRAVGAGIPDDLLDEVALAGTPAAVADRLITIESWLGGLGIKEVALQTVGAGLTDAEVTDNCTSIVDGLARRRHVNGGPADL